MLNEAKSNLSLAMLISGLFSLLLGLTVIIGWYTKNSLLIQLSPHFVPMQFNTALCFMLSGLTTILLFFGQRIFATFFLPFIFLITVLTLLQYFFGNLGIDELFLDHYLTTKTVHAGRMSPNTILCFLLYSNMLLLLLLEKLNNRLLWILNSLLLAFCTLAFLGYVFDVEVVFGWQKYTRMALHTSVGFIILALGAYIQVIKVILKDNKINLIPLPLGTLLLMIFFILGSSIKHKDYLKFRNTLTNDKNILTQKINTDLERIIEAFNRMSIRAEFLENNNDDFWKLDTDSYLKDYKFYKAIEFSDKDHIIRKINPIKGNESLLGYNLIHNHLQEKVLSEAIQNRQIRLTNIQELIQGGRGFLILSPLFKSNMFIGTSIAVIDVDLLFNSILGQAIFKDYNVQVLEKGKEIYYHGEDRSNQALSNFNGDDIFKTSNGWNIILSPSTEYLERNNSYMPEVIILIGAMVSILAGFFAYYTDRLKNLNEKAEASVKAKAMFLANMSHEIRTPMNAIIGLTSVLKEEVTDKLLLEKIDIISASGQSLLGIINDILDLSKIEAGSQPLNKNTFNLDAFLKDQIAMFSALALQKKILFKSKININHDDYIVSDDSKLKQVLTNLIGNALKFTEQGEIILSVDIEKNNQSEQRLYFSVSDTGIGINPKHISKLFKDFSQIEESSTRRFGGTGLGLSIAKKIVEILGGDISVTSELGKGSIFKFWIPYVKGDKYSFEVVDEVKKINSDLAKDLPLSILTVDDNKINLKVASELLKKIGYSTDIASNGNEALELLKVNRYDVIFMDCHMPILDGFETTQMIINIYGTQRPKIIALTASSMEEDIKKCFASGMDDFISKPVSFKALLDILIKYGEENKKI